MKEDHTCFICLGSNFNAASHFHQAKISLDALFPDIEWGETLETKAEGGQTDLPPYLNRLAFFHSPLDIDALKKHFKQLEKRCGRTNESKATGLIPLDIDLLVYDGLLLKPQDMSKHYMQLLAGNFAAFPKHLLKTP